MDSPTDITLNVKVLPAQTENMPIAMSSREIAELTDKIHKNVKRDIETMLLELGEDALKFERIYFDSMNREQTEYLLDRELTETLVLGYSAKLRRKVIARMRELEAALASPRLPTTAEAFANAFQMLAETERRQAEQNAAILAIDAKVDRIEQAQVILKSRPANAESITHIRPRIGKRYGLSHDTIDAVMRNTSYAPRPAGMVRNEREEAEGATFAVYWKKDVSAVFGRFVDECEQVTATRCTHPFIDGRFKLIKPTA